MRNRLLLTGLAIAAGILAYLTVRPFSRLPKQAPQASLPTAEVSGTASRPPPSLPALPAPGTNSPPPRAPSTPATTSPVAAARGDLADVLALGQQLAAAPSGEARERLRRAYTAAAARLDYGDQRSAFWRLQEIEHPAPDLGADGG